MTTESIMIRNQWVADARAFYRILKNGDFDWFPTAPPDLETEMAFLRMNADKRKAGREFNFSVLLGKRLVGAVGYRPDPQHSHVAEAGYFIDRAYWGRGFAVQALELVEAHAAKRGLIRLELLIATDNRQSIRVAEKTGYRREGLLSRKLRLSRGITDAYLYAKLLKEQVVA